MSTTKEFKCEMCKGIFESEGSEKEKVAELRENFGDIPVKGKKHSAEARQKMSEALRGENNPRWKGGVSLGPYCDAWADQEYVNDLKKGACEECGITNMMSLKVVRRQLCMHHKNGPKNCAPSDIMTLCSSCHLRIHRQEQRIKKVA